MAQGNPADDKLIDDWLVYMETSRGRLFRTLETYRAALRRLVEFMAGKPLAEATPVELEAFCGLWLHKKGVIARSRKPYISAVRGFYAWMKAQGHMRGNAASELVHPRTGRPLPRMLGLSNAEKLMWAPDLNTFVGIRDAAILSLLVGCGLRVGGLVRLNEGDLSTESIECVPRLVLRTTEKGERTRRMPVPKEAAMLLQVYLAHEEMKAIDRTTKNARGRPDKVLFVSIRRPLLEPHLYVGEKRRLTRKAIHDIVQRHGKRVGVPIEELHPHAMRHLFGTELTEEDVPTLAVQELMGHADPSSTAIYTDLAMRKKFATVDRAGPLGKLSTPVGELLKRLPK